MDQPQQQPNQVSELLRLVRLMRSSQRAYFKTKSSSNLSAAKQAEQRVDALLKQFPEPNQSTQGMLDLIT